MNLENNQNYMNDNDNNDININEQDETTYFNLDLFKKQNDIMVKVIYPTSYFVYKKKIFMSNINEDFTMIVSLFDENICDVLINIYILYKKKKISDKQYVIFKFIFDLIDKINKINFIDQENFFLIIIDLYILKNLSILIDIFFDDFIFKELIDYKLLINNLDNIFKKLNKKILLYKILEEITLLNKEQNKSKIKDKIIFLSQKISIDMFMFYDSHKMYNIIIKSFEDIIELINLSNIESIILKINKNLLEIFEENKLFFLKEYDKNYKKCFDIYYNDIEIYVKFKITNNDLLDKLIKNINYIDNLQ